MATGIVLSLVSERSALILTSLIEVSQRPLVRVHWHPTDQPIQAERGVAPVACVVVIRCLLRGPLGLHVSLGVPKRPPLDRPTLRVVQGVEVVLSVDCLLQALLSLSDPLTQVCLDYIEDRCIYVEPVVLHLQEEDAYGQEKLVVELR